MIVASTFVSPDLFQARAFLTRAPLIEASTVPEQVPGDALGGAEQ
jgi:hypothetical protein